MRNWLLDTNIVSQLAPKKDRRHQADPRLVEWIRANGDRLFLSAVTMAEIIKGIHGLRRSGAERRADALDEWLARILTIYGERLLPVDLKVGRIAGRIADHAKAVGRDPGLGDVLIAATAEGNDLALLTLNIRHFEPLGLRTPVMGPLDPSMTP